jgi:probable F420-dependent oxidoreductase
MRDTLLSRFGILLTFQAPTRFGVAPEQAYAEALEQAQRAEELGFESVWVTEHHFQEDNYLSSALIGCAAIAARTSAIRVGTAVLILPLLNPIRLAEDVATIDVLSRGRFDLGVGMGYRDEEFEGVGVARSQRRELFEDGLKILQMAWTADGPFDYESRNWKFSGVDVYPKPVQQPHPPLWLGAKSDAGMRRAARLNAPFLLPMTPTLLEVQTQAASYREFLRSEGHDDGSAKIALMREVWVADSQKAAWNEIEGNFRYAYSVTYGPEQIPYFEGKRRITSSADPFMASQSFRNDRMFYGSPLDVAQDALKFGEATGADELICRFQLPGLAHEKVLQSMERFALEVRPKLAGDSTSN